MLDTEFIPAATNSRRLMVVLHGLGDSAAGFRWLPGAMELPWMNYLLVNAPDLYYGGYAWYDFAGNMAPGVRRSRRLIFELLDAQRANGFSTEETVLSGFSQGCLMTIDAGLHYPHRFAGLVGISGYVFEPEKSAAELSPMARQQRFLVTHGYQDPIVPFLETRKQINILKTAGLNISWHEFVKAHTIAGEAELAVIRDFIAAGYKAKAAT
jgi:phospholipase/carboxylesterase